MPIPIIKMASIGLLPSKLKVMYYRMMGAKIGKNVSLGMFTILESSKIEMDDHSKIGPFTFINARSIKIGKRAKINSMVAVDTGEFELGNDSTIMEQVVIGGMLSPRSKIIIGKRVKIFPYSFLNPTEAIFIDDDAGIGGANYIFTHGSWQSKLDGFPISFGPVHIKKGVWFPWRVFVMPNVTVGEYATIGAGSILTKDVPDYSLAAGSPAKVLRTKDEYIKQYSKEEKVKMVFDILKELDEYLSFSGKESKIVEENNLGLKFKCATHSLAFFVDSIENSPNESVVVSFSKISEAQKSQFNKEKKIWFDLESKETYFHDSFPWLSTRDFFSRYGIRFKTFPE